MSTTQPSMLIARTMPPAGPAASIVTALLPRTAARVPLPRKNAKPATRRIRMVAGVVMATLFLLLSGGFGPTTAPAHAWLWDDALCFYQSPDEPNDNISSWPGMTNGISQIFIKGPSDAVGNVLQDGAAFTATGTSNLGNSAEGAVEFLRRWTQPYAPDTKVTAYEWFGTAGLSWSIERYKELNTQCPIGSADMLNMVANLFLGVNNILAEITISLVGFVNSIDAFAPFTDAVEDVLLTFRNALFLQYLTPMVLLAAITLAYQGLVKKRASEAVQGAAWIVGAASAALLVLSNPMAIAGTANQLATNISSEIVSSLSSAGAGVAENWCSLPAGTDGEGWRESQCTMWNTFLFTPWSNGYFGPIASSAITITEDADGNAVPPVKIPGHADNYSVPALWLAAHTYNHDEVIRYYFKGEDREAVLAAKHQQWTAVFKYITNRDGAGWMARSIFSGDASMDRIGIALLAILAGALSLIPILFLSGSILILQISLVFLMLLAPLFLTVGIHPGFGRRAALGWVEMVLSNLLKRIGTAVLLGILLVLIQSISRAGGNWFVQVMLTAIASIAVITSRKKVLNQLTKINLGGTSPQQFRGNTGNMLKGALIGAAVKGGVEKIQGGSFRQGAASGLSSRNPATAIRNGLSRLLRGGGGKSRGGSDTGERRGNNGGTDSKTKTKDKGNSGSPTATPAGVDTPGAPVESDAAAEALNRIRDRNHDRTAGGDATVDTAVSGAEQQPASGAPAGGPRRPRTSGDRTQGLPASVSRRLRRKVNDQRRVSDTVDQAANARGGRTQGGGRHTPGGRASHPTTVSDPVVKARAAQVREASVAEVVSDTGGAGEGAGGVVDSGQVTQMSRLERRWEARRAAFNAEREKNDAAATARRERREARWEERRQNVVSPISRVNNGPIKRPTPPTE